MSRTFTLARLMFGMTLFCVACGLAVQLPLDLRTGAHVAGVFASAIIVWALVLVRLTRQPMVLLLACIVGSFVTFMFSAAMLHPGSHFRPQRSNIGLFLIDLFLPSLGAFLVGATFIAHEFRQRHRSPS